MKKCLMALLALVMIFVLAVIPIQAAMNSLDLIWTNPGENSSTEMNISWHSNVASNTITYSEASDTTFARGTTLNVTGIKSEVTYTGNTSFYRCEIALTNLNPNTKYIYKISNGTAVSSVHTFKTAGSNGNFNFAVVGDIHSSNSEAAKITNTDLLIAASESETANTGGIDFVLSCGDIVKYGQTYSDWQQWNKSKMAENYMVACAIGNHEYYSSSKNRTTNNWFNTAMSNPNNGVEGLDSTYWFIYNSVLFLCMDTICDEASQMDPNVVSNSLQQAWFEDVIQANEGNYQYIIVYKHYPDFVNSNTTDHSSYKYGNYTNWYKLYDKYGVDYVISGDSHCYVRSAHLYDNNPTTIKKQGTVYLTCPQIYTSWYSTAIVDAPNNPLVEVYHSGATTGGLFFEVTTSGIKMSLVAYTDNTTYEIYDTDYVYAKRSYPIDEYIDLFKDSLTVTSDINLKTTCHLDFASKVMQYIDKIEVYNGTSLLATILPSTNNVNSITLTDLASDQVINLTLNVTYSNEETENIDVKCHTYGFCGYLYNLKATVSDNNITLNWKQNLNAIAHQVAIYADDVKITQVATNVTSYVLNKDAYSSNTKYTLKVVTSTGDVLYEVSCNYDLLGDANFDGNVNKDDVTYLTNSILHSQSFTESELRILDFNNDRKISVYDVKTLATALNNHETITKDLGSYTVTFVDGENNVINTQTISYGNNAILPSAPTLADHSFVGWSLSNESITKSLVIRALYSTSEVN